MKTLKDFFEKVFIISLPGDEDRLQKLKNELNQLGYYEPYIEVFVAVRGNEVGVPAWWKSGGGAWGCLMSHAGVIQEATKRGLDSFLVLEDNAVVSTHFEEQLDKFLRNVPSNWDQIYLGGQNLLEPVRINSEVIEPKDMNRTHAFGLRRKAYAKVHSHILHAPDYISAYEDGWHPHVDHQLGRAHRRGDWRTYAPATNIFGQRENMSNINGSWHPDKWWDWPEGNCFMMLPYVIIENNGLFKEVRGKHWRGKRRSGQVAHGLHFGWVRGGNQLTFREAWDNPDSPGILYQPFATIAREAFECRRLPAFYGNEQQISFLKAGWPGGTTTLKDLGKSGIEIRKRIDQMIDYPWNGILKIREAA